MGGVNKLTVRKVQTNKAVGRLSNGAGLYLVTSTSGAKKWVYMWRRYHKRREMGLGGFPSIGLETARQKAQIARELVALGKDSIEERIRKGKQVARGLPQKKRPND